MNDFAENWQHSSEATRTTQTELNASIFSVVIATASAICSEECEFFSAFTINKNIYTIIRPTVLTV